MTPPTTSDLIFSEQANHNFSKTLGEIKRHTLSIQNRLQSILQDAAFVQRVSTAYGRPLIANERCGSWYIDSNNKDGSAYFKSTDGHTGVWSFSTRRLNIHLLGRIGEHDGFVIGSNSRTVQELRDLDVSLWTQHEEGRVRMPDALSKTIPVWCSVINRALFPDMTEHHELYTPPQVVSSSEHAQITARLEGFLLSFLTLDIDCATLRAQITRPLRPIWVTPESCISSEDTIFEDYHPIICCTASRRVPGGEVSEGGYIQGSGDDTENWAFGLTPPIFWSNSELLLATPEAELPELISKLIAGSSSSTTNNAYKLAPIPPTSTLHITDLKTAAHQPANQHNLIISLHPEITLPHDIQPTLHHLHLALGPHKLGSRNLRTALPAIAAFITTHLLLLTHEPSETSSKTPTPTAASNSNSSPHTDEPSITIACASGKDHSVSVALALLCLFYDAEGRLRCADSKGGNGRDNGGIDKVYIRRRLGWIVTAMPEANPSGATLQSVNGFLMPKR